MSERQGLYALAALLVVAPGSAPAQGQPALRGRIVRLERVRIR